MVTPHGAASHIDQGPARFSDPRRAQDPATSPRDIRCPEFATTGRSQERGSSPDSTLKTFGRPAHVAGLQFDHTLPHFDMSLLDTEDYFTSSSKYLHPSTNCAGSPEALFSYSHLPRGGSVSSQAGASSTPSPPPDIFSTQSSPGYLHTEFPNPLDTARPHSVGGQHPESLHYLGSYSQHLPTDPRYNVTLLPRPHSMHELPSLYRPVDDFWNALPSTGMPAISQTSRCAVSQLPHAEMPLFSASGRYPTIDNLHRWPQMFGRGVRTAAKKQTLACHFCRDRKIGCTRPDEDDPDQTCNQCARRKRQCEYPTESRRGQHARRRISKKCNIPTVIPPTLNTSF